MAISPEQVAELTPQRGAMRQLDYVIWKTQDAGQGLGVKHVRDDEFWVPGHIPGRPLMPGVMMLEACAQLCGVLHRLRADPNRGIPGAVAGAGTAMMVTTLTTAVGFLSLSLSRVPGLRNGGLMIALGILAILLATATVLPALGALGRKRGTT